jgi:hypothetical protein
MSTITNFESRTAKVSGSAVEVFNFAADFRNLAKFIPGDKVTEISVNPDSCSFYVSMLGKVSVSITEKTYPVRIIYSGNAPQVNDFSLSLSISDNGKGNAEVKIIFGATLNPLLRMVAHGAAMQLLENLVSEMEKFRDWKVSR